MDKRILEIANRKNLIYATADIDGIRQQGFKEWNNWNKNKYPLILEDCRIITKELFNSDLEELVAIVFYNVYVSQDFNVDYSLREEYKEIFSYDFPTATKDCNHFCRKYFKKICKKLENDKEKMANISDLIWTAYEM